MKDCKINGCDRPAGTRGWCAMHYSRWYRHGDTGPAWGGDDDGLGVCTCPVSYPDPKCCRRCGYPCVHRMAPRIRDLAVAKMPQLAQQTVATVERGAA